MAFRKPVVDTPSLPNEADAINDRVVVAAKAAVAWTRRLLDQTATLTGTNGFDPNAGGHSGAADRESDRHGIPLDPSCVPYL
jgi:hypothetical protein